MGPEHPYPRCAIALAKLMSGPWNEAKSGRMNGTCTEKGSAAKNSSYAPRDGRSEMLAAEGTHSNHTLKRS